MDIELIFIYRYHLINGKPYLCLEGAEYGERSSSQDSLKILTGPLLGQTINDYKSATKDLELYAMDWSIWSMIERNENKDLIIRLNTFRQLIKNAPPSVISVEEGNGSDLPIVQDKKIIEIITTRFTRYNSEKNLQSNQSDLVSIEFYYNEITKSVLCQDYQVKRILAAVYTWQKIINSKLFSDQIKHVKSNIFIVGAPGTGKTEIILQISRLLNIPIIIEDATRYTAEGYVGQSTDDLLINLITKCGGDIEKAQNGIIVIDEADKLNSNQKSDGISTTSVQNSLISMMEGGVYTVGKGRNVNSQTYTIDTTRILFVLIGSFENQMISPKALGFGAESVSGFSYVNLTSKELIKMGMTKELIGRSPSIIGLNNLTTDDYIKIIHNSKISYLKIMKDVYSSMGVTLKFTEGFIRKLASLASASATGVRAIEEIVNKLIGEKEYESHAGKIKEIILDETAFTNHGRMMTFY